MRHGPDCTAYYEHLWACRQCSPRGSHYCAEGQRLRVAYMVPLWVADVLATPLREDRAVLLAACPADLRDQVKREAVTRWECGERPPPDAEWAARAHRRRMVDESEARAAKRAADAGRA